jgi:hypothetical protein
MKNLLSILALCAVAYCVIGCKMLDQALLDPNPAYTPPATNAPAPPAPPVPPFVSDPKVETGLALAAGSGIPYAGLAGSIGLLLVSTYRNIRNKQTSRALVEGIAGARGILKTTAEGRILDAKIKEELKRSQLARGVLGEVDKLIDTYTTPQVGP